MHTTGMLGHYQRRETVWLCSVGAGGGGAWVALVLNTGIFDCKYLNVMT